MKKTEIKLTTGRLVSVDFFRSNMWNEEIPFSYSNFESILIIYAITPKFTRITCYPVNYNEVWKFSIKLKTISPQLADKVANIFKTTNIIHTTGMCEEKALFQIENYIPPDKDSHKGEEIREQLSKIQEIEDVTFNIIKITK